jgi:hypothetical protein
MSARLSVGLSLALVLCLTCISAVEAADVPCDTEFKIVISPGVGNKLPNGQPIISFAPNCKVPKQNATSVSPSPTGPTGPTAIPRPMPVALPAGCGNGSVEMCGTAIPIAGPNGVGDYIPLNMPAPFVPDPFSVQCIIVDGLARYSVSDSSSVSCALTSDASP